MHTIQKQILRLSRKENIGAYGYRKLGEKIGVDHPQKVKWHLQKLINDGYLVRDGAGELSPSSPQDLSGKMLHIPILGQANCGQALSFADNTHWGDLTISPKLLNVRRRRGLFAVKAVGDSMNQADINGSSIDDGDYVIIDASKEVPRSGDYVVSSVEGLANVKKYIRDEANRVIALVSESTRPRPPIMIHPDDSDSYRVHGTVAAVIKTPI